MKETPTQDLLALRESLANSGLNQIFLKNSNLLGGDIDPTMLYECDGQTGCTSDTGGSCTNTQCTTNA